MPEATSSFRGFVAVMLPDPILDAADAIIQQMRGAGGEVRWTAKANLHLTLKFLGNVRQDLVPALREQLAEAAATTAPFEIALGGLGAFPRWERPQVIWAGVSSGFDALAALATRVEKGCARVGFEEEGRPYRAHLTLGRLKEARGNAAARALRSRAEALGSASIGAITVEAIHLVQSTLTPRGSIYTVLETFELARREAQGVRVETPAARG
jgi:2'-5' RNA ligase